MINQNLDVSSQLTQTEHELVNPLEEMLKNVLKKFDKNGDDFFPYPYIFKPSSPPGDEALEEQLKPEFIPPDKKQE